MNKSTTLTLLAIAAGATAALAACGRPSTDSHFGFNGTGDPQYPAQNIIHGKYAGTFDLSQFNSFETCGPGATASCYGLLFSNLKDLYLVGGFFNSEAIEGLGGLALFPEHASVPPRLMGDCYTSMNVQPQLGGSLTWTDVGSAVTTLMPRNGQAGTIQVKADRDSGPHFGPLYDALYYAGGFDANDPATDSNSIKTQATIDAAPVIVNWLGGSLGGFGYPTAPARLSTSVVLHTPEAVQNLTVNGAPLDATPIAAANDYTIAWTPATAKTDLFGMSVTVQVYGPADLSSPGHVEVEDWPWFNELGETTCSVKDSAGQFLLKQSVIESLITQVKATKAYAKATKDVNHDGVLSPWSCVKQGSNLVCTGEDANADGHIDDKIMGVALIVNRRTERSLADLSPFSACIKGSSESDCARRAPVFISGNDLFVARMATHKPN